MTYERFIDRKDKRNIVNKAADFRKRQHGLPPTWIIYLFLAAILSVIIMTNYMSVRLIMWSDSEPAPLNEIIAFMVIITIMLTGIGIFSYLLLKRTRDLILYTEFQNLLFANTAGFDSVFFIIISPEKELIYYNSGFPEALPPQKKASDYSFELLLENLSESTKEKLVTTIENKEATEIVTDKKAEFLSNTTIRTIPVPRPEGFIAIRAEQTNNG